MASAGGVFSLGWVAGFAAADGWWALMLARRYASPTFPMFNFWFRSPLFPPASVLDGRFFPHGIGQWLVYPFAWAVHPAAMVSEQPLRDPRLALGLCLALATLLRPRLPPVPRALLAFFAVGYGAWLATSSILRYAIVLEAASGLLAPLLLTRLLGSLIGVRLAAAAAFAMAAAVLATTRYPATLRVPYGAATLEAGAAEVPAGTLLALTFRAPVSVLGSAACPGARADCGQCGRHRARGPRLGAARPHGRADP